MPINGIHAARQKPPGKCDKIRTQPDAMGKGVTVLWCVRAGKPVEPESIHFDAQAFTADEARAWLKRHQFKADQFEVAAEVRAAAGPDLACAMVDQADCPMGDKCPMRDKGVPAEVIEDASAEPAPIEIRASATGTCEIEAQAADSTALPRVNMLAYTGVPMKLDGFHLPVVVDLETLKVPRQKVPILRGHDADRIAGHSDSIDVSPQRLRASGVLSGTPKHTLDVVHTSKNGFPWQVSIGAQTTGRVQHVPAGESVKVNGRKWDGPLLVARNAVLRELSILPMGADGNTDAGFSAGGGPDLLARAVADLIAYDCDDDAEITVLTAAFCPTGAGGGVDPSCPSGGGGGSDRPTGSRRKTKVSGKDVTVELGADGRETVVEGPKEMVGKRLSQKATDAAKPKAPEPKPEPKTKAKPAVKPDAAKPEPAAPEAKPGGRDFKSAAEAESHFDEAHNVTIKKGGGIGEKEFLASASHIDGEHTRLKSEFKAVEAMSSTRVGNTRLEVGHDYWKDPGRESNTGHFHTSGSLGGQDIVLGNLLEVDAGHIPATGGHDVGKDLGTVFRHELGHEVYHSNRFTNSRKNWDKSFGHHVGTSNVSQYGGTNHSELFAESFSAYTSANYKAGTLPKDIESWMDKHVRGKK